MAGASASSSITASHLVYWIPSGVGGKGLAFFHRGIVRIHHKMCVFISCLRMLPSRFEVVAFRILSSLGQPGIWSEFGVLWDIIEKIRTDLLRSELLGPHHSSGLAVSALESSRNPGAWFTSPCSVNRNGPGVIVEVLDQACYQAPHFHQLWCDAVHAGPGINEDGGKTVRRGLLFQY